MNKVVFISTRYSVLSEKSILRSRDKGEDIISKTMDEKRLANRLNLFLNTCSLSISNQIESDVEIDFQVIVSDLLPEKHLNAIKNRLSEISFLGMANTIVSVVDSGEKEGVVKEFASLDEAIDSNIRERVKSYNEVAYASVRLDDDDALAKDFCNKVSKYLNKNLAGYVLSFPFGYQGVFCNKECLIKELKDMYIPKIALGLSYINFHSTDVGFYSSPVNVYALGNHTNVDQLRPVITDSLSHMYVRTINESNDSGEIGFHKNLPAPYKDEKDISLFDFLNLDFSDLVSFPKGTDVRVDKKRRMGMARPTVARMQKIILDLKKKLKEKND